MRRESSYLRGKTRTISHCLRPRCMQHFADHNIDGLGRKIFERIGANYFDLFSSWVSVQKLARNSRIFGKLLDAINLGSQLSRKKGKRTHPASQLEYALAGLYDIGDSFPEPLHTLAILKHDLIRIHLGIETGTCSAA